ncbi:MAG: hypothetical protein IPJ03_16670 [Ignavibacteriales bacterium]|nr:hypothetical protein [Ignavibacteriales bacterium]
MTLNDIRNTPVIDCCQAMDWIEHNYTKGLPHEHTPIVENYPTLKLYAVIL